MVVQPVTASPETLAARCREPGPPTLRERFFLAVAATAEELARAWGLTVLPPLRTDTVSLDDAVRLVMAALNVPARAVA